MHTCREPFRRCTAEAWCAAQKRRASCKQASWRFRATEAVGTTGQGGASDPRRCCGEEVTGSARRAHVFHRATLCAHQSSENANCAGQSQILRERGSECRRVACSQVLIDCKHAQALEDRMAMKSDNRMLRGQLAQSQRRTGELEAERDSLRLAHVTTQSVRAA